MTATTSSERVFVAGHRGLVGAAIWRRLEAGGADLVGRISAELDLRDRDTTLAFFDDERPSSVYLAAARVGGIVANSREPVEFLSDNLRIQLNVLEAAKTVRTKRLLFLGSSCIYPKFAPHPITEDATLTGPLEPTNGRLGRREARGDPSYSSSSSRVRTQAHLSDANEPLRTRRQL